MNNQKNLYLRAALACFIATTTTNLFCNSEFAIRATTSNQCAGMGPFEMHGKRGQPRDTTLAQVRENVVPATAITKHATDQEIAEYCSAHGLKNSRTEAIKHATQRDKKHGSTLSQDLPQELQAELFGPIAAQLKADKQNVKDLAAYYANNANESKFYSLRYGVTAFLKPDKAARDNDIQLPILDSFVQLEGNNPTEIKRNLMHQVMTPDFLQNCTTMQKPEATWKRYLPTVVSNALKTKADDQINKENAAKNKTEATLYKAVMEKDPALAPFTTPFGQQVRIFQYWCNELENALRVASKEDINEIKKHAKKTIGCPELKANILRQQALNQKSSIIAIQEANETIIRGVTRNNDFVMPQGQFLKQNDTVIVLDPKVYSDFKAVAYPDYARFSRGALNGVVTRHTASGNLVHAVCCHASSSDPKDANEVLKAAKNRHKELEQAYGEKIYLVVLGDQNVKNKDKKDYEKEHRDAVAANGFVMTSDKVITNVKTRLITAQPSKAEEKVISSGDHVYGLAEQVNTIRDIQVGFSQGYLPETTPLPNTELEDPYKWELSDHKTRTVEITFKR